MKGRKKPIGFFVGLVPVTFLMLLYLEVFKNTVLGWVLTVILMAAFAFIRIRFLADKKWWQKFLCWIAVLALFIGVVGISQPPVRQIAAVDVKHPEVTDVVTVEQGQLTGVYNEDSSVAVYAGIPYAKPPVGDLRWTEPQEPESWDGVRVCDTFAPMSMQSPSDPIYDFGSSIIGYHNVKITPKDNFIPAASEDSLYLNVWTPSGVEPGDDLPVFVYIHGGSLTTGQSYYQDYNGETFAKNGVVYITITYRLGVFGYLATEELAAESENGTTGNYGLLDQIQALKWINENVKAFGGDASNITIAGESAGSSSVNALCVSPLAKGLFRRAIGESSGIAAVQPYHTFRSYEDALETGEDIMEEFGCSTMEEMRALSAEELLETEYENGSMTVDGYAITEQPYLTYEKGENNEEALLNGFNADEAYVFLMFSPKPTAETYEAFVEKYIGDQAPLITSLLPVSNDDEAKQNFNDFMGLAWFGYSHHVWSNYLMQQDKPVYLYFFRKENGSLGTWHAGELPYAYGNLDMTTHNYDDADAKVSDLMVQYWLNFAKYGDPNGSGLPEWKKYNDTPTEFMVFDTETGMEKNPYLDIFGALDAYQETLRK